MAAMTQEQTDRYKYLDEKKGKLTADELKELNILQKLNSGEDMDADNKGGDNNPQEFTDRENVNEEGLTDKELAEQRSATAH